MKVLVTGSRDYGDKRRLYEMLDRWQEQEGLDTIIEGCARGADRLAERWAQDRGVPIIHCPADWGQHGRAAGAIRNKEMVARHHPDAVIAFFTNRLSPSRGTAHMVAVAMGRDIPVVVA